MYASRETIHVKYFYICTRAYRICKRCSKGMKLQIYNQQATNGRDAHLKNLSSNSIFHRNMIFIISIIFVCLDSLLTALCILMVITIHCRYFCACARANVLCTRCSKRIKLKIYKQQATHTSYAHMENRITKCIFWRDMIFSNLHYFCVSSTHSTCTTRTHCYCSALLQQPPPLESNS